MRRPVALRAGTTRSTLTIGCPARSGPSHERWDVPLIHSMHDGEVKNLSLATGDAPEPSLRVLGEQQVDSADRLIANTESEAADLHALYDADPTQTAVVHPGVDLERFAPGDKGRARARNGLPPNAIVLLFVGRIQPLKAPDVVIRSTAALVDHDPQLRSKLVTVICGGPSGAGPERLDELRKLAAELGVADIIRFVPPTSREDSPTGIDPLTSSACRLTRNRSGSSRSRHRHGTPVAAAAVGGLHTAVADGTSGTCSRSPHRHVAGHIE